MKTQDKKEKELYRSQAFFSKSEPIGTNEDWSKIKRRHNTYKDKRSLPIFKQIRESCDVLNTHQFFKDRTSMQLSLLNNSCTLFPCQPTFSGNVFEMHMSSIDHQRHPSDNIWLSLDNRKFRCVRKCLRLMGRGRMTDHGDCHSKSCPWTLGLGKLNVTHGRQKNNISISKN